MEPTLKGRYPATEGARREVDAVRRNWCAILVAILVLLPATAPVTAQSGTPMPYADYRAATEAAIQAESDAQEATGSLTTVDDALVRFGASIDRAQLEVNRLKAITPEDCYADAHAEMIAYREYSIATLRDTLPLIKDAKSVMGMLPMLLAADATVRAAHPAAYVEDSSSMTGWTSKPLNILDTLAMCAFTAPVSSADSDPSAPGAMPTAAASPAQPGELIHQWTGNDIVTLPGGPIVVSWADEGCALTLKWESGAGVDVEIVHTGDLEGDTGSVTVDLPSGPGRLDVSAGCFTDAPAWSVEFSTP
jgi:hypothetical protein